MAENVLDIPQLSGCLSELGLELLVCALELVEVEAWPHLRKADGQLSLIVSERANLYCRRLVNLVLEAGPSISPRL